MGRLGHEPSIQHLSHPHPLHLTNPQTLTTPCSGCELPSSGWMYTCKPCNFTLHVSCTQMPQLINHPSHPSHSLTLLPTPPYPGGVFNCDGCGSHGHGFSYHCNHCDFDVHILCASKPLFLMHHLHAHKLELTFESPYQTKGFSCDICRKLGSNHWLYRCSLCEFDAHVDCASVVVKAPQAQTQTQIQIQHHNSFPGGYQLQNGNFTPARMNNFAHSQSMGTLQNSQVGMPRMNYNVNGNYAPLNNNFAHSQIMGTPQNSQVGISRMNNNVNGNYAPSNNNFVHSQSLGTFQNSQVGMPGPANNNVNGNFLVNAAVQGFAEGAAQQVGQNFMQNMMNDRSAGGDGGNGCDPGSNNGGDNSSSMMGSILTGIFGDSSETQS
ncbi:hypothetical protein ACOSQ4_026030 [Xanthoceras sorbifolium]